MCERERERDRDRERCALIFYEIKGKDRKHHKHGLGWRRFSFIDRLSVRSPWLV